MNRRQPAKRMSGQAIAGTSGGLQLAFPWSESGEIPRLDNCTVSSEKMIAGVALALGADSVGPLSKLELSLVRGAPDPDPAHIEEIRLRIQQGCDPIGTAFCSVRSPATRRKSGAVYTPEVIVRAMLDWAQEACDPVRIIEPGAGSGRFLLESGKRFPSAMLVAVETDPLASLMVRANLSAAGLASRSQVILRDFRSVRFESVNGCTLYVGNPPYVRHHLIEGSWKNWLKKQADVLNLKASTLAGLHVYFLLAIARWAEAGDHGAFITASEWLDVNYGQLVRELFLDRLGGQSVHVIEPDADPFPGTQATGAVTTFVVDEKPMAARFARITRLEDLNRLDSGRLIRRERLETEKRWSHFTLKPPDVPSGYIELGELFRVHRGQVTGANRVWIAGEHSHSLPDRVLYAAVTRGSELIEIGSVLRDQRLLRRVIDLPEDLSELSGGLRRAVEEFLVAAEAMGARNSYVARHRRAWWSVGLREPAPILATYMARRAPSFVFNEAQARHINIAHGLYPREALEHAVILALVRYLRDSVSIQGGRVYAGGLTKFEPREMERIPIPKPGLLEEVFA